jgi:cis-3-alkyl-4-acyloxetan-2-one decarboxylase
MTREPAPRATLDVGATQWVDAPGDTVLTDPPADYLQGGSGRWFVLPEGRDAGRRMHVIEREIGSGGPPVLFVHGNPECSYTYRHAVSALAAAPPRQGARIVIPDHIGFGRSDRARYEMVDMHHAANLTQLVTALDLRDITLVVHDWGGPIGIGSLLLDAPERVSNLVILNTTVFPMPPKGLTYENFPVPLVFPWARSARVVPDRLWGTHAVAAISVRKASYAALVLDYARFMAGHRKRRIPRDNADELLVFRDQLACPENTLSSKRQVRQTPVWGYGYRYVDPTRGPQDNHDFYAAIQSAIGPTWGPQGSAIGAAAVVGAWDPLGKPSVLAQWTRALPQLEANIEVHPQDGHFLEEHRGTETAAAIARLIDRDARPAATLTN